MFNGFNENTCLTASLLKLVCHVDPLAILVKFSCVVAHESRAATCLGYVIFRRAFCITAARLPGKKESMHHNIDISSYWGSEMCVTSCSQGVVKDIIGWLIPFTNVPRLRLDSAKVGRSYSNLGMVVLVANQLVEPG